MPWPGHTLSCSWPHWPPHPFPAFLPGWNEKSSWTHPGTYLGTLLSSSMNNLSSLQLRMILSTLLSYLHSQDLIHNRVSFDYSQLPNQPWHNKSYFPFPPKENEQPASPWIIGQTSETTALPDFQIVVLLLSGSPFLQTAAEPCSPEDTST